MARSSKSSKNQNLRSLWRRGTTTLASCRVGASMASAKSDPRGVVSQTSLAVSILGKRKTCSSNWPIELNHSWPPDSRKRIRRIQIQQQSTTLTEKNGWLFYITRCPNGFDHQFFRGSWLKFSHHPSSGYLHKVHQSKAKKGSKTPANLRAWRDGIKYNMGTSCYIPIL